MYEVIEVDKEVIERMKRRLVEPKKETVKVRDLLTDSFDSVEVKKTKYQIAVDKWNSLAPMEKTKYMEEVPHQKSLKKRYRSLIKMIEEELP